MTRWLIAAVGALAFAGVAHAGPGLADLIQARQDPAALKMIDAGANVNVRQGDGTTALDWATYRLDVPMVKALLKHGADPDLMNDLGSSPLDEAAKAGNLPLVKMLLKARAAADEPNPDGQTALMLAARTGVVPVAKLLVRHGANVNARERWRGQTALMWAAAQGHADMTRFLVRHGANVNSRDYYNDWLDKATQVTSEPRAQYRPGGGLTPLLYAARSGCLGCVQALLKGGAKIDRPTPKGYTPLITAIDNYHFDVAKYLLQHGANPNIWDWYGRTPLYVAVDMVTYFAHYGPKDHPDSTTPLDLVKTLLADGANPNAQLDLHRPGRGGNSGRFRDNLLRTGCTPLLLAAISHDTAAIKLLLAHGALVDLPNVNGVTPLMAAAGRGWSAHSLFGARADFAPPPQAQANAVNTIAVLLAAGANINARAMNPNRHTGRIGGGRGSRLFFGNGQTALFGAITQAWPRVVQYLIQRGANVNLADQTGVTPLMAATRGAGSFHRGGFEPNKQIVALLTKAGAVGRVAATGQPAALQPPEEPVAQRTPQAANR
ncbi:MAG: ankyrin repeat domain-containing protein [Steroidobacteraceae bacterium]